MGVGAALVLLLLAIPTSPAPAPCTIDADCEGGAHFTCRRSECAIATACSADSDCRAGEEWCQVWTDYRPNRSPTPRSKCTQFARYGEWCEGYVAPGYRQRCQPDTVCEFPPEVEVIPDIGGQCECAGELQYTECGTACEPACDQPPVDICIEMCVAGCQCPPGQTRLSSGSTQCVSKCAADVDV